MKHRDFLKVFSGSAFFFCLFQKQNSQFVPIFLVFLFFLGLNNEEIKDEIGKNKKRMRKGKGEGKEKLSLF